MTDITISYYFIELFLTTSIYLICVMNYQSGALGKPCMHPKMKPKKMHAIKTNSHLIFFICFFFWGGSVQNFPMLSPLQPHQGIMLKSKERAVRLHKDGGWRFRRFSGGFFGNQTVFRSEWTLEWTCVGPFGFFRQEEIRAKTGWKVFFGDSLVLLGKRSGMNLGWMSNLSFNIFINFTRL